VTRKLVAQLSQRDRAAEWVTDVQKWNCNWETIFYKHYTSVLNHCDVIGQISNRIRWKNAK